MQLTKIARILKPAKKENSNLPQVQVSYLGKVADAALANTYGVNSSPPKDSLAIAIQIGNNPANKVILSLSNDGINENLKEGETEIGNFVTKSNILFKEDGNIEVTSVNDVTVDCKNANVTCETLCEITAPNIKLNGNVAINGSMSSSGGISAKGIINSEQDVTAAGKSLTGHTHTGNLGNPTSTPN